MTSIPGVILDNTNADEAAATLASGDVSSVVTEAARWLIRSGAFSIFDQAVVSATSFLTTLILARSTSQAEVGVFALASTIVLFLGAVQGNLITVPYTIYCHRHQSDALAEYAGSTLVHQFLTSLVAIAGFASLGLVLATGLGPERLQPAIWVLVGVIPFVLLREYVRRFAFAHLAMATAVTVDVVVAVLQLGALLIFRRLEILTAATTYSAIGAACGVACLCWWLIDRQPMRFDSSRFVADWRSNWSFGKWAFLSQLAGLAYYILPWMLAAVHGEADTGELAACTTLVGLANLFVMGMNNFLMPKAARAFTNDGPMGLVRVLRKVMVYFCVVLGGLCGVLFLAGGFLAGTLYGPEYSDTGPLIALLSLGVFADGLGLTASTGLWAMDRPGIGIIGDLVQLLASLGIATWLVFPWGAMGVGVAIFLGRMAGAAVRWTSLWRLIERREMEQPGT
jgi:O-antigen/teichoic acid export membrane protein